MGYLLPLVLICSACLADTESSLSQMPPLPDFKTPVDYAAWVGDLIDGPMGDIAIVEDSHSKVIDFEKAAKPVQDFIDDLIRHPDAWDATQHPEVAKWVHEVQKNASKNLHDLPWLVYDSKNASFSKEDSTVLLMDVLYPNTEDLKAVIHADIMAALEKSEPHPLKHLEHALTTMQEEIAGFSLIDMLYKDRYRRYFCDTTKWLLCNRDLPASELNDYLSKLEAILAPDIREHFIQAMRLECAGQLSMIQWLTWIDPDGEVRYNPAKVKQCFDTFMPATRGWSMLMRADADPAADARQCREYHASICDATRKTMENPSRADFSHLDTQYLQKSFFANCFPFQWGQKYIPQRQSQERQRRLDCLTLRLLQAKKQLGRWPETLADLKTKAPNIRKDPSTGKPFEYRVEKDNAFLDNEPLACEPGSNE